MPVLMAGCKVTSGTVLLPRRKLTGAVFVWSTLVLLLDRGTEGVRRGNGHAGVTQRAHVDATCFSGRFGRKFNARRQIIDIDAEHGGKICGHAGNVDGDGIVLRKGRSSECKGTGECQASEFRHVILL